MKLIELMLLLTCALGVPVASFGQSPQETVLYSFTGGADGGTPFAGLIADSGGTVLGEEAGAGVACDCSRSRTPSVPRSFPPTPIAR
jgi:hypothetical protein